MRDLADELLHAKVRARLFGGDHAPRLGRLRILDRIGGGAMGTVYAAYDPRLDREVAVKVLHAAGSEAGARVLREARALARLAHPNVVAVHDAGEEDGVVYVVMELVTGVPLRVWIQSEDETARDWRAIVRVLREVAAGLAAAHRIGLVHRDVKPDNVVVGDDRVRVIDLGLAVDDEASDAAGTPSYMAPEVLAGAAATPASDQFSFGVLAYEALYGQRPHTGATRADLRSSARRAASAPARRVVISAGALAPTVEAEHERAEGATEQPTARAARGAPPAWVHAIVKRALAAAPGDRFPSMDALATALARDPDRRRRRLAVGVLAVAALALGGLGALALGGADAPTDPCAGGAARRAAVWDPDTEQRLARRLADAPWATSSIATLGRTANGFETSYRRVCEATRVDGTQSDRLLELRVHCLDRAIERFGVLVGALEERRLDATTRAEVATAVAQLPDPERCERVVDDATLALPEDPARRARVRTAQHGLDRAWAAYVLGDYRDARTQIAAIDAATADLDDVPALRATVLALHAAVESRIGTPATARTLLDRALVAAATAHAPELELDVWSRLLRHELFSGQPARTIEWVGFAHAAAARAGFEGAEIDGIVGEALRSAGRLDEARDRLRRAVASRDPLRGDQRALLEMNLGSVELAAGHTELAATAFDRAYEAARRALGDGHPTLALYLDKLAEADRARGRIVDALARHDAGIALRRTALGDRDRAVATGLFHRAETLIAARRLDEATRDLDEARAIRVTCFGASSPRLGEIDAARGDVAAARGLADEARALYASAAALDPRLDRALRR